MIKFGRLSVAAGLIACLLSAGATQAQGVTRTTILIGQSGPLSGANKEFGEDIRDGALAYFSAVNAAGGINRRKLELITIDDANDAQRSGENGRVLIEEKGVLAVYGRGAHAQVPPLCVQHARKLCRRAGKNRGFLRQHRDKAVLGPSLRRCSRKGKPRGG